MPTKTRRILALTFTALALTTSACESNPEITDQPESDPQPGLEETPREEEN